MNPKIDHSQKNSASADFFLSDLLAALAASFVILSLGAAFGVMSGRGALIGIIASGVVPMLTAFTSGSRIQCSGPTGPVTVITAGIVAMASENFLSLGLADAYVNFVLLLSAVFVLFFAFFRLGRLVLLIPKVVISGFMTGIAVIITVNQLGLVHDYAVLHPENFAYNLLVVVVSTWLMFTVPSFTKNFCGRYGRFLSGTFVTIVLVTVLAQVFLFPIPTIDLGLTKEGFVWSEVFSFQTWDTSFLSVFALSQAFFWALQLAFVMSLDSLMTAVVMDQKTGHMTSKNQELLSQGWATVWMAFLGLVPTAQATVRSVLILNEGAKTRWASFFLGGFILLQLVFFRDLIALVPEAVFIGIVLKIAYDIADWRPFVIYARQLFCDQSFVTKNFFSRHDESPVFITNREIILILMTVLLTVITNLFIAVLIMTLLYYGANTFIWKKNPLRDLKPDTETEGFTDED